MDLVRAMLNLIFPPKFMIKKQGKYWRVCLVATNRIIGFRAIPVGDKFERISEAAKFLEQIGSKTHANTRT